MKMTSEKLNTDQSERRTFVVIVLEQTNQTPEKNID